MNKARQANGIAANADWHCARPRTERTAGRDRELSRSGYLSAGRSPSARIRLGEVFKMSQTEVARVNEILRQLRDLLRQKEGTDRARRGMVGRLRRLSSIPPFFGENSLTANGGQYMI